MGGKTALLSVSALFAWVLVVSTAHARQMEDVAGTAIITTTAASVFADPPQSSFAGEQINQIFQNADLSPAARQLYEALIGLKKAMTLKHGDMDAVRDKLSGDYSQGTSMAAFELGLLYGDKRYKGHSDELSSRWFKRAAESGVYGAIVPLVVNMQSRACNGDKQAVSLWWHWLRTGADANLHFAELSVARAYARGDLVAIECQKHFAPPGLEADPEKAAYWFEQSVPWAGPGQLDDIADRFQNGYGVPQRLDEALRLYKLESAKGDDIGEGYNNAAWLLATCPFMTQSHKGEAVELARRALAASRSEKNNDPGWTATIEDTMAGAYARDGDYRRAVSTERKAIKLMHSVEGGQDEEAELARFYKRLASYEQSRPSLMANHCREPSSQSAFPGAP